MKMLYKALLISIFIVSTSQTFYDNTTTSSEPIDCATCCKQGRWTSTECCRACNGCDMYNDEAAQECRDFPS